MTDPDIENARRRLTALAALRQLRRMVDQDILMQHWQARWANRIGAGFAIIGVLLVFLLLSIR